MDKKINIQRGVFYSALIGIFGLFITAWINIHNRIGVLEKRMEVTETIRERNEEIIRRNTVRYEQILNDLSEIKMSLQQKQDKKFIE